VEEESLSVKNGTDDNLALIAPQSPHHAAAETHRHSELAPALDHEEKIPEG
jgi:hypothetical protein